MSGRERGTSRRGFLSLGWAWALGSWLGGSRRPLEAAPQDRTAPGRARSRVVLVRRADVLRSDGQADPAVLRGMLDQAMASLLAVPTAVEAWKRLFRPGDVVGVKTNVWSNLPTPPALEEAIRENLATAGVALRDIAIDDRGVRDDPVFRRATALVNVRPMRIHYWSGLGTCLKNMIMFAPQPSDYHGDTCASLGALWQLPEIAGKVRLNVLVMLTPHFHGVGPHAFSPRFTWPYRGLIVGTDPVAVDATGARIITAHRRLHFGEDKPLSPPAHHIEIADTRYRLGNSNPANIDLVHLGWQEGALI